MSETVTLDALLDAALPHAAFEGWSPLTFSEAARDVGITDDQALALAPRGALDLAMALHRRGDRVMVDQMAATNLSEMRYRDRVVTALRYRVEALPDREAVRRATALFSVPTYSAEGAKLIWETADHIWIALGDASKDGNWYSKRATLSAVWGSTVLFWLGDDSPGYQATLDFIDRRIDNVMQIEGLKGRMRKNPLTKPLMDLQQAVFEKVRAPGAGTRPDLPGRWEQ